MHLRKLVEGVSQLVEGVSQRYKGRKAKESLGCQREAMQHKER